MSDKSYKEVEDGRNIYQLTENIILREQKGPRFLRKQYQNMNGTKLGRNQKLLNKKLNN